MLRGKKLCGMCVGPKEEVTLDALDALEARVASRLQLLHELNTPLRVRITDPEDGEWGARCTRAHRTDLLSLPWFAHDRELARRALALSFATSTCYTRAS
jgi:hypothetical protein